MAKLVVLVFLTVLISANADDEDQGPVIPPSKCEVCKFLAIELRDRLEETGKTKEVLETGHGLDTRKKKRFKYNTSELRLIEALQEPNVCDKILEYNVHKEREGSNRFAKGMSETFQTLHGLRNKGVKVELGIPEELWDTPSAEVTQLQKSCYTVVERYEEVIEDWYYNHQDKDILDFLCRDHVLDRDDQKCLDEKFVPKGDKKTKDSDKSGDKKNKKKKGQKKSSKGKQKGETDPKDEL